MQLDAIKIADLLGKASLFFFIFVFVLSPLGASALGGYSLLLSIILGIAWIFANIESGKLKAKHQFNELKIKLTQLSKQPEDPNLYSQLNTQLDGKPSPYLQSQELYDLGLAIFQASPTNTNIKTLVLKLGRWHYSKNRISQAPTIYDEQAIQNDIIARSK